MKKNLFLLMAISVAFASCKTTKIQPVQVSHEADTTLQDTVQREGSDYSALMYPADLLYVIGREYEEFSDSTSAKSQSDMAKEILAENISLPQYMEMRLVELYPQKAFRGMMSDFDLSKITGLAHSDDPVHTFGREELSSILPSFGATQTDLFHFFNSLEDEAQFLNLTPRELERYKLLNALAEADEFACVEDVERLRDSVPEDIPEQDKTFLMEENVFLSSLFFATGGGYVAYRVLQSKERAVYKAYEYYGSDINCGKRGDAFKHLYVSMLLRRYLSENVSHLVMDEFWERKAVNSPCDRQMDLHNNFVGRNTQYDHFRGDFWQDGRDWEKWSSTIHNFVENNANSIEKHWNKGLPEYVVVKDLETTNKRRYVFWNPTSECENP